MILNFVPAFSSLAKNFPARRSRGELPIFHCPAAAGRFTAEIVATPFIQSASDNRQSAMDLAEFVKKYTELSGGFGGAVHLSEFGLSKAEMEKLFSTFDDDYQISRYMVLSREPDEDLVSYPSDARVYSINGFEASHVSLAPGIRTVL